MFDVGFSELIVIGIVALVVIGPERLPKVARTVGLLLGRAQRYVNDVKADINREIQLDELKKLQTQVTESARTLEASVREEFESARSAIEGPVQSAAAELEAAADPVPAEPVAEPAAETPSESPALSPAREPVVLPETPAAVADSAHKTA